MAINLITYDDKVALNENPDIPAINKVQDSDMNQIKSVVNGNANNIGDMAQLGTLATNLISAIIEVDGKNNYSTTEQVIGTWVNGKPIYRKVLLLTSPPTPNTWTTYDHGVSNLETYINCYGIMQVRQYFYMSNYYEANIYAFNIVPTPTQVTANITQDGWCNKSMIVIIEYTKTTD